MKLIASLIAATDSDAQSAMALGRPDHAPALAFQTPKPFSRHREIVPKQGGPTLTSITDGISVMWAFIDNLYREYCLARLQEIRKYELSH